MSSCCIVAITKDIFPPPIIFFLTVLEHTIRLAILFCCKQHDKVSFLNSAFNKIIHLPLNAVMTSVQSVVSSSVVLRRAQRGQKPLR